MARGGNVPVEDLGVCAVLESRVAGEKLLRAPASLGEVEEVMAQCWQQQKI